MPPKTDRNEAIYQRDLAGGSPSVLAREYGISEQRAYITLRNERKKKQ